MASLLLPPLVNLYILSFCEPAALGLYGDAERLRDELRDGDREPCVAGTAGDDERSTLELREFSPLLQLVGCSSSTSAEGWGEPLRTVAGSSSGTTAELPISISSSSSSCWTTLSMAGTGDRGGVSAFVSAAGVGAGLSDRFAFLSGGGEGERLPTLLRLPLRLRAAAAAGRGERTGDLLRLRLSGLAVRLLTSFLLLSLNRLSTFLPVLSGLLSLRSLAISL